MSGGHFDIVGDSRVVALVGMVWPRLAADFEAASSAVTSSAR